MNRNRHQRLLVRHMSLPSSHGWLRSIYRWWRSVHWLPSIIQRQLKVRIVSRCGLSSLPCNLPRVPFDDRAIALPMELSHVIVDAWLACSGIIALIGVDAFLPGAREPPPEHYEACDDEAAETADGNCPDWCHCCCGSIWVLFWGLIWLWSEEAGSGVWCGAEEWGVEMESATSRQLGVFSSSLSSVDACGCLERMANDWFFQYRPYENNRRYL